jgi:hypothetical protein
MRSIYQIEHDDLTICWPNVPQLSPPSGTPRRDCAARLIRSRGLGGAGHGAATEPGSSPASA